jgi:hypothetical protein
MLKLLTCVHGHFWEAVVGDGAPEPPPPCPECGAPADGLPVLDFAPSETAVTIAPPPPGAPPLFDPSGRPVVAGYEILEPLGKGPTGVYRYRARQAVINRLVLLEVVLAREDASQQAWGSLRGASFALGKLSHPNISQLHEAGERDRQVFYNVSEFVDGPTLAQKVAAKPLPFPQVARLMEVLARAVDYAHEEGVVHRNLKPSSVLLQPMPGPRADVADASLPAAWVQLHSGWYVPRITDFGLAKRPVEGDVTDVELFGDLPGYLSPEQAWGRSREIGPATDVYGLGAILYHLLAGRPPFRGPTVADVLDAIQTAPLTPPSDIHSIPDDLDAICRKCLARQPRKRYTTASELADDLRRALLLLPLRGRPTSGPARLAKWVRRRPAAAALVLVAVLGLVGTVAGYVTGVEQGIGDQERVRRLEFELAQRRDENARRDAEMQALRAQGQFTLYRQRLQQAREALERRADEEARAVLEECPEQMRRFEWDYLKQLAVGGKPLNLVLPASVSGLAFNEGARHLALAWNDPGIRKGRVRIWNVPTRETALELTNLPGPVHAIAFSPDGQNLASAGGGAGDRNGELRVWSLRDGPWRGTRVLRHSPGGARLTGVVYAPGGEHLYCAEAGGIIHKLSTVNGQPVSRPFGQQVFRPARTLITRLLIDPQGARLLSFTSGENTALLWDTTTDMRIATLTGTGPVQAAALGVRDAIAWGDQIVRVYEQPRPQEQRLGPFPKAVRRLAFSPDGKRLVLALEDGTLRVWGYSGAFWVELLSATTNGTSGLAFTPSGRGLAVANGREVQVWGDVGEFGNGE